MEIKTIGIVGLGALGTMYTYHLTKALGKERVFVLADPERIRRYEEAGVYFNGERCDFSYVDITKAGEADVPSPDLIMVSCKYLALPAVIEAIKPWVTPETTIISVLNGIASEKDLRQVFDEDQVISCVARKMSAVKEGNHVTADPGELVIGPERPEQEERAKAVDAFLTEAGFPHVLSDQIVKELWSKLLCNTGVNQSAMVHEMTYGDLQKPCPERDEMIAAMREVVMVAQAEGVPLSEEDVAFWVNVINGLEPTGEPSMRQDGKARRPSEVELFAGTIKRLAEAHGLSVPVNERWYAYIKELEETY